MGVGWGISPSGSKADYKAASLNQCGPNHEKHMRQNTRSRNEARSGHLEYDKDYISSDWGRGVGWGVEAGILNKWDWFGHLERSPCESFPYSLNPFKL